MTTESDLRNALGKRLADLCEWLAGALEVGEQRDAETVATAKDAFIQWICDGWDRNAGDVDGALEHGLQDYVESCVSWVDGRRSLEQDLSLAASPPWSVPEFHLLVAYALADKALSAFKKGTPKQIILAAMLYADAVEARESWEKIRGPAGAREPNTTLGVMQQMLRRMDAEIAVNNALPQLTRESRRANAKHAAKARLANDPKQQAKALTKQFWLDWKAGKHPSIRTVERFATEAMRRTPILESANVIRRWSADWGRELKQEGL